MSSIPPKSPGEQPGLRFWWVQEDERVCGPYTGKQMLAFLLKGRIRPATRVRPDTERHWRLACEDSEFARYFAGPMPEPVPGSGAGGESGRRLPNFMIVVEGGTCPAERTDAVIGELGSTCRLSRDVWILQCGLQLDKIRTYLARQLSAVERLFIVDMRTGMWAGHKCGPELEERLRKLTEAVETDME